VLIDSRDRFTPTPSLSRAILPIMRAARAASPTASS